MRRLKAAAILVLSGCAAHHQQGTGVQAIVGPDGSAQHLIECPDAQLECVLVAGQVCPRGYDPQPGAGWLIVRCRDGASQGSATETASVRPMLPLTSPLQRSPRAARYASRGTVRIGGELDFNSEVFKIDSRPGRDEAVSFGGAPVVGAFPVDGLEIHLGPIVQLFWSRDTRRNATSEDLIGGVLGARYLFPTGPVFPFIGVEGGWVTLASKREPAAGKPTRTHGDGLYYGGRVGADVPIGGPAIAGLGLSFGHANIELSDSNADAETKFTLLTIATAFSVFF